MSAKNAMNDIESGSSSDSNKRQRTEGRQSEQNKAGGGSVIELQQKSALETESGSFTTGDWTQDLRYKQFRGPAKDVEISSPTKVSGSLNQSISVQQVEGSTLPSLLNNPLSGLDTLVQSITNVSQTTDNNRLHTYNIEGRNHSRVSNNLQRLTESNFEEVVYDLLKLRISSIDELSRIAELVFTRAIRNPYFATIFARLCERLNTSWRITSNSDGKVIDFLQAINQKCKLLFYKKTEAIVIQSENRNTSMSVEMIQKKARSLKSGNLRFIGELYNRGMLDNHFVSQMLEKWLRVPNGESIAELILFYKVIARKLEFEQINQPEYFREYHNLMKELKEVPVDGDEASIQKVMDSVEEINHKRKYLKENCLLTPLKSLNTRAEIVELERTQQTISPSVSARITTKAVDITPLLRSIGLLVNSTTHGERMTTREDDRAPIFIEPENRQQVIINEGQLVVLKGKTEGFPFPEFEWYVNGNKIITNRLIERRDNKSETLLTFKEVEKWNQGKYTAIATNYCGRDHTEFDLVVLTKASQPAGPLVVSDVHETGCTLKWGPPSSDGGSVIKEYWVQIYSCESNTWSSEIRTKNHYLNVKELIPERDYKFRVQALNGVGISNALKINRPVRTQKLIPPPSAPLNPRVTDYKGDEIVIAWDEPIRADDLYGYVVEYKSALATSSLWKTSITHNNVQKYTAIPNISPSTVYTFRVKAYNRSGPGEYSEVITNKLAPSMTSLANEMTFQQGDDVVIEVRFTGLPFPTPVWKQNGVRIDASERMSIRSNEYHSTLNIKNAVPSDSSVIEITVHNPIGSKKETTKLIVLALPPPGTPLTVEQTLNNSVMLTWPPPEETNIQSFSGFVLDMCEIDDSNEDQWQVLAVLVKSEYFFEAPQFTEGRYKFRISSYRKEHKSHYVYSDPITIQLKRSRPSRPGRPVIIDYNETDLRLKWTPPEDDGGLPITSYRMKLNKISGSVSKMDYKEFNLKECEAVVTGFLPKALVTLQVKAFNELGASDPSLPCEPHLIRPKSAEPKIINKEIKTTRIRLGSSYVYETKICGKTPIEMKWSKVNSDSDLTLDEDIVIRKEQDFTSLNLKKASLHHHGVYQLIASNEWGSDIILFKLSVVSTPSRPEGPLEIHDIHETGCTLRWKAPISKGNLPITQYIVSKNSLSQNRLLVVNRDVKSTEWKIEGLIPGNRYSFQVVAINEEGQSPPLESEIIISSGKGSDQGAKIDPRITNYDETSVTLEWNQTQNPLLIKNYLIKKRVLKDLLYQRFENLVFELDKVVSNNTTSTVITNLKEGHYVQLKVIEIDVRGKEIPSETTPFHRIRPKFKKPKIVGGFSPETHCRLDSVLDYWVSVDGEPHPTFKWLIDGVEITKNRRDVKIIGTNHSTCLSIIGVRKHHEGVYKLIVTNEYGCDEAETKLKIVPKPDQPVPPLEVTKITANSCRLEWKPFENNTTVDYFLVELNDSKPDKWTEYAKTGSHETFCEIQDLKKGREYKFRVRAVNVAGRSAALSSRFIKLNESDVIPTNNQTIMNWKITDNNFRNDEDAKVYRVGNRVQIRMPYTSTQEPRIIIHKDGKVINASNFQVFMNRTQVMLLNERPTRQDSGRYLIEAKIGDISDINYFRLLIVDVPSKPRLPFEVIYINEKRMQCSWQYSRFDGGSPITSYVLERKKNDKGKWEKLYENKYTRCDLEVSSEEASYTYRVSAVNQFECSKYLTVIKPFIKDKKKSAGGMQLRKSSYAKIQSKPSKTLQAKEVIRQLDINLSDVTEEDSLIGD